MTFYICIALLVTIIGIIMAVLNKEDVQKMSLCLSAAFSLAISVLVFPYYTMQSDLVIAVIQAFRAGVSGIALGVDGSIPYQLQLEGGVFQVYRFFLFTLYVLGPLAASVFAVSYSSRIKTALSFIGKKHLYVFSDLNRRSIMIAESIAKEKREGKIIFCNCKNTDLELVNRAMQISAMMINSAENKLVLLKNKYFEFFEVWEDDRKRIEATARLCESLLKQKNYDADLTMVRVFASPSQKELLLNLDRQYAGKIYLRHIDEENALAIDALSLCMDTLATKKECNVAIIDDNESCIAFIKNLLTLMIKPDGENLIRLIGPGSERSYASLLKDAPEIDRYPLEVYDCDHGEETEAFKDGCHFDVVFILYDEGELAYETASRIRRYLSGQSADLYCPQILCYMADPSFNKIIKEDKITLFGDYGKTCDYSRLVNPDLEASAKKVHLSYLASGDESILDLDPAKQDDLLETTGFYHYQNQESSFAEALTLKYKRRYILSFKDDEELSDNEFIDKWLSDEENMKKMAYAEHDRWNAYQRCHGWRKADEKQTAAIIRKYDGKRANDPELLLHPALVENEQLAEAQQMVNKLMEEYGSDRRVYYTDADKDIIKKISYIIEE